MWSFGKSSVRVIWSISFALSCHLGFSPASLPLPSFPLCLTFHINYDDCFGPVVFLLPLSPSQLVSFQPFTSHFCRHSPSRPCITHPISSPTPPSPRWSLSTSSSLESRPQPFLSSIMSHSHSLQHRSLTSKRCSDYLYKLIVFLSTFHLSLLK